MNAYSAANNYIDTNLIRFYHPDRAPVGTVNEIAVDSDNNINIKVTLNSDRSHSGSPVTLLVVDKYHRYLHHFPVETARQRSGPMTQNLEIPLSRVLNISPSRPIKVCLLFSPSNIAMALDYDDQVYERLEAAMKNQQTEPAPEVPTFRPQLLNLVLAATNHKYVSRSNQSCIPTGNNYQTLELGDTLRLGGRARRFERLNQIQFRGKKVLDIGANTGEISRYIRRLGASLVDGYEYDSFFVETGRMINAYTGATRVSLYQGDATNPALYSEKYDIVVALSVYVYIREVLKNISDLTDAMVFETHTLDHGLNFYLDAICKYFPFFRHLGFTDEDPKLSKSRALLLFTTKKELLEQIVNTDAISIPPGLVNYYYNNEKRSFWKDLVLTEENLPLLSNDGFDALLAQIENKFEANKPRTLKDEEFRFFSPMYWFFYLAGYNDYLRDENQITVHNRFLKYYSAGIEKGELDHNLKYLLDEKDTMYKKLELKYQDLDRARRYGLHALPPIHLSRTTEQQDNFSFKTTDQKEIIATDIDGHHRLFIAKLLGAKNFPFYETEAGADEFHQRVIPSRYTLTEK